MFETEFTNVKYTKTELPDGSERNPSGIKAVVDSQTIFVPIKEGNRHYDEIMRQVNAGTLTIEEAD
jgi:hypothetical protein